MYLISKKLFSTFFTGKPTHKDWIHKNIIAEKKKWRLYDTVVCGCEEIFQNEMGCFFEYMLNQNLKIFYISALPKHNITYSEECFNFFKLFKDVSENTPMPENVKKLRELQCDDLIYFYDNLILESFFIISKIKNNKYYYDMIIVVKNDFDIKNFYKINFNIIVIDRIDSIFYENITYNFMQQLFNFNELDSYGFCDILDQGYTDIIYNPEHKETKEYKDLQTYENQQIALKNYKMQHNNPLYWFYENEYNGVVSEMTDQRLMFKYYFSNFGWQWFILNYNFEDLYKVEAQKYTYPVNEPFLLTTEGMATPIAVIKQTGKIEEYNQQYETGCMLDLISLLRGYNNYFVESSIISVPKIKYNTSYKCRLKKK